MYLIDDGIFCLDPRTPSSAFPMCFLGFPLDWESKGIVSQYEGKSGTGAIRWHKSNNVFFSFPEYFTVTATTVTKTIFEVQLTLKCQNVRYFRYFNGKLRNGRPKYSHIRHQRIQINSNYRFVFRFSQILC